MGPWCAEATWFPPGVPEATDRVRISPGHRVVLDGSCVQVAADVTTQADPRWTDPVPRGTLASAGGQTLRIGDPLGNYAIENFGSIELAGGDRLEIDCDSTWTPSCTAANRPGSRFVARGARLGTGVVTAVFGENCPANSDFLPDAPFQASDCTDVAIEVEGLGAVEDGDPRFVGRFIRFDWPSAHRGTWYRIAGASAPNRLTLDYNSEAQQAARGIGPATATAIASVAQGSTEVAWPGGLDGADARVSIGAWFACDDDCPAVTNDSPFPGASLERLPCASARRIVDVPMTCEGGPNAGALCPDGNECSGGTCSAVSGRLWLESGYPTATCADGAAARIIGSSAGNGYAAVDYVERFAPGDPFVVWDPVTLTVPVENRQFASTQDKTVGGLHIDDDSVVDFEGVRMSFWGRGDSGILAGYDPIQTNFTPANSSGALYLRHVEIAHFGGGEAVNYRNVKNGLGANEDVTVRDPLPTDQGVDPSRGHGVWLNEYDYAGGNGVAVIVRFRGTRLGDDCIVVNGGSTSAPDAHEFARITLDHPTCTFASTLAQQPSAQCFDLQDPELMVRDGVDVLAPLCSNYQNGGFWWANSPNGAATSGRFLVSDGVFQNLQEPCLGTGTRSDFNALRVVLVNSLCRALPAHTAQAGVTAMGSFGADVFSSYFADAVRGIADADVVKGAFVRLGYRNGASGLYTGMSEPENFTASDQTYEDVAVSRAPCPPGMSCPIARGFEVDSRDERDLGPLAHARHLRGARGEHRRRGVPALRQPDRARDGARLGRLGHPPAVPRSGAAADPRRIEQPVREHAVLLHSGGCGLSAAVADDALERRDRGALAGDRRSDAASRHDAVHHGDERLDARGRARRGAGFLGAARARASAPRRARPAGGTHSCVCRRRRRRRPVRRARRVPDGRLSGAALPGRSRRLHGGRLGLRSASSRASRPRAVSASARPPACVRTASTRACPASRASRPATDRTTTAMD